MDDPRRLHLTITPAEAFTLSVALSEYVALWEEGTIEDLQDELELADPKLLLNASDAAELQGRIDALHHL